jgi:hypothetical protein
MIFRNYPNFSVLFTPPAGSLSSSSRAPVNRVANCYSSENIKCLRQSKPFLAKFYSQAVYFESITDLIAVCFRTSHPYDSNCSILFAIAKRFLGYYVETFEDNILTFIRKLLTKQKSSIKPAFYSPSELCPREKK